MTGLTFSAVNVSINQRHKLFSVFRKYLEFSCVFVFVFVF